jgi:hypothetical protein
VGGLLPEHRSPRQRWIDPALFTRLGFSGPVLVLVTARPTSSRNIDADPGDIRLVTHRSHPFPKTGALCRSIARSNPALRSPLP